MHDAAPGHAQGPQVAGLGRARAEQRGSQGQSNLPLLRLVARAAGEVAGGGVRAAARDWDE